MGSHHLCRNRNLAPAHLLGLTPLTESPKPIPRSYCAPPFSRGIRFIYWLARVIFQKAAVSFCCFLTANGSREGEQRQRGRPGPRALRGPIFLKSVLNGKEAN